MAKDVQSKIKDSVGRCGIDVLLHTHTHARTQENPIQI